MSEENATEINGMPLPNRSTRKRFVIYMLLFCAAVIIYTIGWGAPGNSLHVSALAWAWGVAATTFFAYVFGAVVDNFNVLRNKK